MIALPGLRPIPALSIAFWLWCALLSYPMISDSHDLAELAHAFTTSTASTVSQIAGLALFMVTAVFFYAGHVRSFLRRITPSQAALIAIIYLSAFFQVHGEELGTLLGLVYTTLLLATIVALSATWTLAPHDFERSMRGASIVLCLFGVSAIAILGWPQGRNVGSIQPNLFAAPLLASFIFSQFAAGTAGVVIRVLCLTMIALVSSRFALLGCLSAFAIFELTRRPLRGSTIAIMVGAILIAAAFQQQIASILALDDSTRDVSSGFAGRDEYWISAINAISESPLGIGFKRAVGDEAGHNGYLKILLEFGVIGGGLVILIIFQTIVSAFMEAFRTAGKTQQLNRFDRARLGGLFALAFGGFFQPQLLSLGDAFAVCFLLMMFRIAPLAPDIDTRQKSPQLNALLARPALRGNVQDDPQFCAFVRGRRRLDH